MALENAVRRLEDGTKQLVHVPRVVFGLEGVLREIWMTSGNGRNTQNYLFFVVGSKFETHNTVYLHACGADESHEPYISRLVYED